MRGGDASDPGPGRHWRAQSSLRSGWHLERHVTEQRERLSRRQSRSRSGSASGSSGDAECASPGEECPQRAAPKAATPIVASTVTAPEVSPASTVATASLPHTPYGQDTSAGGGAPATRCRRAGGAQSRPRPPAGEDEPALRGDMPAEKRGRDSRGNVVAGDATAVEEEEEEEDSVDKLRPALTGEVEEEDGEVVSEHTAAMEARQVSKRLVSAFEPISGMEEVA